MDLLREYFYELRDKTLNSEREICLDAVASGVVLKALSDIDDILKERTDEWKGKSWKDKKEGVKKVMRRFVEQNLKKDYLIPVRENGRSKLYSVNVYANLWKEPFQWIVTLKDEFFAIGAKRMILAMSRTQEIINSGTETPKIPANENHLKTNGKQKHKGAKFSYSTGMVDDEGKHFQAILTIMFPTSKKDQIYSINVEGSATFEDRRAEIISALESVEGGSAVVKFYKKG